MDDLDHVLANSSNYYAALRITRTATREEITTSYRRMALKCHPDKVHESKRDKAHRAFQVLENAKKTLSDDTTRRVYDSRGVEGVLRHESGGGGGGGGPQFRRRQPGPEDVFEQFFFGFAGQQQQHARRQQGGHHHQGQAMEINPALLLVPVILFLLMAMFLQSTFENQGSRFGGRSSASRQPALETQFGIVYDERQGYTTKRTTRLYNTYDVRLDYYVTSSWHRLAENGQIDMRKVEAAVLGAWSGSYGRQCEAETMRQRSKGDFSAPSSCVKYDTIRRLVRA